MHLLRGRRIAPLIIALLFTASAPAWAQPATAPAASPVAPAVQAFPSPGSRTVSPESQISFRGVSTLPRVEVLGSVTGAHPGRLVQHSDHAGVSFVPAAPFAPGETVTVRTPLAVAGSGGGDFTYQVARPATASPNAPSIYPTMATPAAPGTATPSATPSASTAGPYRSRPDLKPPPVTATVPPGAVHAPGLLFASSGVQTSTADTGVMIYDDSGQPVWFDTLPATGLGTLQPIQYKGQNALTWFTGTQAFQGGFKGTWIVVDSTYHQIGQIAAGNGLTADAHELRISADGTKALLDIYNPVHQDMTPYGGPADATVYEAVVQEIDLGTGAVTFEWHSLDESPVTDSYEALSTQDVDYFHLNSMEYDTDGGILLSGRHVSQALKLDRGAPTGARVLWRLGGKRSTYTFPVASDAPSYAHDVRRRPDGTISLYDNGVHSTQNGRGIAYRLDDTAHTATAVTTWNHSPGVFGVIVGSNRLLDNGDELVSYGSTGTATEYDKTGAKVWESQFGDGAWPYRTLRVEGWHALPAEPPALASDRSGTAVTGYASWNGATDVASWVLLAGPSADQLRPVSAVTPRSGFETTLTGTVTAQDTVLVAEARDGSGGVLRRSTGSDTSTPIQAHYNLLGGPGGFLGSQTTAETTLADGAYAGYQHGVIYYSPATQAWEVHGAILGTWSAIGAEQSVLGYPSTDERGLPDGVGRYNLFASGSIYWTQQTGAHEVHGAIGGKWSGLGSQTSFLGYPLTNEVGTPDGQGRFNHFQGGSVYWTQQTGAQEVHGAIRDKWGALGYETGVLGYPTGDETTAQDGVGRFNQFQGGSVYWTQQTGAQEVHGAIRDKWGALGYETGVLGYPTSDETPTPDGVGRFNAFAGTGGSGIYWTPNTGAHAVQGAIYARWASLGWERSALGYPTSDEYAIPGGRRSDFTGGTITWQASTGATQVTYR